jgi:hypothetical protein
MSITKKILMAKARGFTISTAKMNEKERLNTPSGKYGDDYNNLLKLTIELYPDLESILPPKVDIYTTDFGDSFSSSRYNEIDTYCEQIYQLVSDSEDL